MAVSKHRMMMEFKKILEEVIRKAEKEGKSRKLFSEMIEFGLIEEIKIKITEKEKMMKISKKLEMKKWLSRRIARKRMRYWTWSGRSTA